MIREGQLNFMLLGAVAMRDPLRSSVEKAVATAKKVA